MQAMLWVFLGGGIGSVARYALSSSLKFSSLFHFRSLPHFPNFAWQTLLINTAGSFLLAFMAMLYRQYIFHLPAESASLKQWQQVVIPLLFAGFCGGFTTFSSYVLDVWNLLLGGDFGRAVLLLFLHLALGLLAAGAAIWLALRTASLLASS